MNKKIVHLLTNKLPILSVIILILSYIYLSIPDDYVIQIGGLNKGTHPLPKSTPLMYKARWAIALIPLLIFIHLIYSAYFYYNMKTLTMWDAGKDFFYNFQIALNKAISIKGGLTPSMSAGQMFDYKSATDPDSAEAKADPDIYKLYNMISLTADPRSAGYVNSQYFCNAFRPCNCCKEEGYTTFFPNQAAYCGVPYVKPAADVIAAQAATTAAANAAAVAADTAAALLVTTPSNFNSPS